MAVAETANLLIKLSLGGNFSSQIAKATSQLKGLDGSARRVGKGAGQLAGGLARVGTIGVVAVGGALAYAAKQAIDFEDAFQGVVKTVDAADLKSAGLTFGDLSDSIRKMSLEMPIAATELAGIAEQAGALGIKAKDIEAFTRQVAILGSTTDVSTEDAATALGQLQNAIGLTGDEFDNFAATLVDLGNKGASTESKILEVTSRIGSAGHQIGLTKDQTLAWGAALANLPDLPELSGTAGQTFFAETQVAVAKGGENLKLLGKIAGTTGKQFREAFRKDASGALTAFLRGLTKLPKEDRLLAIRDLFGKRTGMGRIVNELADSLDQNLVPALDNAKTAWFESSAAQAEFDKRNATVRSALTRLKNGVIDAAVSFGEGMTPAIGRAADKLAGFLKQDANRQQLKDLGKEIGQFIDNIDWQGVIDGGKTLLGIMRLAGDAALSLLGVIGKLPKEVLAVGGGALLLNKLSGGLLGAGAGNIIAGLAGPLAKNLAASIPIFGRAFVQPVFVTNMGAGGLGGGLPGGLASGVAAAAGGIGLGTIGALVIAPASIAAIGLAITGHFDPERRKDDAGRALTASGRGVPDWNNKGLQALIGSMSGSDTNARRVAQETADRLGTVTGDSFDRAIIPTTSAITDAKAQIATEGAQGRSTTLSGAAIGAAATHMGSASIVGAIYANRPIINVNVSPTTISHTTNVMNRYGSMGGSRVQDGSGVLHNGAN